MTKMIMLVALVLMIQFAASSERIEKMSNAVYNLQQTLEDAQVTACWKETIVRGVGKPVHACDANHPEEQASLCYPLCNPGYYGVGPVCWKPCPDGFTDIGALCSRSGSIISADNSACPWYDLCGLTFSRGCSKCPPGYNNDGCTCRIDPVVIAKESYGRGAGVPLGCAPNEVYDAGLCYSPCPRGHDGVGPVCWQQCASTEFPNNCGAICTTTSQVCNEKVASMAKEVITTILDAILAYEDPSKIIDAIKQSLSTALGFVLPICWVRADYSGSTIDGEGLNGSSSGGNGTVVALSVVGAVAACALLVAGFIVHRRRSAQKVADAQSDNAAIYVAPTYVAMESSNL